MTRQQEQGKDAGGSQVTLPQRALRTGGTPEPVHLPFPSGDHQIPVRSPKQRRGVMSAELKHGGMRLCPHFSSPGLTPTSSACATTQVTAAKGLLNTCHSRALMGWRTVSASHAQPRPSQPPPRTSNSPSAPHLQPWRGDGSPGTTTDPGRRHSPALTLPPSTRDATKAGARSPIPQPFGAPSAGTVSNIPAGDTAALGARNPNSFLAAPAFPPCALGTGVRLEPRTHP